MNNYEPKKEKAAASLILAKQYHQAGDLAGAKRLYDKILAGDPRHVEALHLKGVLFYQKGEPVVAVKMIRQALLLSPNYLEAQANLGLAYEALGKLESAEHCYRDLLRKNRNLAGVHNNLGFVFKRKHERFFSAIQLFLDDFLCDFEWL